MFTHQSLIIALALAPSCLLAQPRFISVTPENASLPDGNLLGRQDGEAFWKWLPGEGNGGILESRAHESGGNAAPLRVLVDGLAPGVDHEVFGYFWAPGFGEQDKDKELNQWPARFGFGMASMTTYGGRYHQRIPWIVAPGSEVGGFAGVASTVEEARPLKGIDLVTADGDTRLIRARLGVARADAKGTLHVYVDDFPESIHTGKTRIDGIAIQPAPKDSIAMAGSGDPKVLHLALRANDWPSAQRELDAGADVNALDSRGVSTLFHPASSGDKEMVKRLLKAGADPNIPGQVVLTLTAAASTGDVGMVRLLVDAGAEVPEGRIEVSETLRSWDLHRNTNDEKNDQALLHPAIAAIRAGSLESLKVLLEKRPDLDLENLGRLLEPEKSDQEKPSVALFLVEDAMRQGNDELAAFLIDRGCTLSARVFLEGDRSSKPRPHALLARSITDGATLEKSRESLLRRGISPIYKLGPPYYSQMNHRYGIPPWDGLSAAVCVANPELTRKFLLEAEGLPLYYEEFLFAMARWHGEPRILSLLEQKFPDAGKTPFRSLSLTAQDQSPDALRLLLPRTKPSPAMERPEDDDLTLAVIASPQAGGQGAYLEVEASKQNGWTVVDRTEVDKALRESQIADPWGGGEYRFAELGDRMAADLLLLVSRIDAQQMMLLRFEVIDVATGLAVMREHVDSKAFDPKKSAAPMLQRARAAILSARAGDRPTAITLLPFSIDKSVWNSNSLVGIFRSAVQAEVDATPGVLTVGMNEIKAVGGEQALGGEGSFWAAAYTLEGGVAQLEDGRIALTLRMQSMKQGDAKPVDHIETGLQSELPSLAAKAWKALSESKQLDINGAARAPAPDDKQRAAEAARLLREAEWLLASNLHSDAVPLLERANLLGAAPEPLVQAHYSALIRQIPFFRHMSQLETNGSHITEHPLTLRHQWLILNSLDAAQNLVDQMAYYLSRHGAQSLGWRKHGLNHTLIALSFMRASIPAVLPDGVSPDAVSLFCESLDSYTAEYFRIRLSAKQPSMMREGMRINFRMQGEYVTAAMLRRNPELLKGWLSLFFAASNVTPENSYYEELFTVLTGGGMPHQYGKKKLLLDAIAARMEQVSPPQRAQREAELAYLSSFGDARIAATRKYCEAVSMQGRMRWHKTPSWVALDTVLARFGMSSLGQQSGNEWLIPSVVHEPLGGNDWLSQAGYEWVIRTHMRLEVIPHGDAKRYRDVNSPWNSFTSRAEAASKQKDAHRALNEIYDKAGRWELIHGRVTRDPLEKHCRRLFPLENPDQPNEGLKAPLLVDLRNLDPSMPGMFLMPTVDNKKKDRIWLHYQPFEKEPQSGTTPLSLRRQPKVVGIDCGSGKIMVTADIAKAPGLSPGAAARNSLGLIQHYTGFLSQTDDLILTSVRWGGMESRAAAMPEAGVLIRKDTGQLIGLKPAVALQELSDLPYATMYAFGAVAVGDHFISAIESERGENPSGRSSNNPHELIKVGPDGTVTTLTQYGRRPQVTPFDPIDRIPRMLVPDGNRVLVLHNWEHGARYSPANDTWQMCGEKPDQLHKLTKQKVDQDFRHHIFSCHRIPKSESAPEIIIQWDQTLPGMLALSKHGGELRRIQVNLEMPEGFADEIVYSFDARDKQNQFVSYRTHEGTDKFSIVVLNQTKTHLILAKQVGRGFRWSVGKRTGEYLPLLWALPIKELQDALMAQQ